MCLYDLGGKKCVVIDFHLLLLMEVFIVEDGLTLILKSILITFQISIMHTLFAVWQLYTHELCSK